MQALARLGIPATRQNYLDAAGIEEPVDAETEASLPEFEAPAPDLVRPAARVNADIEVRPAILGR